MRYRADLDGLRAIAVIFVLLFHANFPLPGAFIGVDIFFTLSGYLITSIITAAIRDGTFTLSSFYIRRSLRLLPAAVTVVTTTAFSALALLPTQAARQTIVSAIAGNASVSNIRFLLQSGYFDSDAINKPLLHTWSLAVEEQFYLIWPFLLILFHQRLNPRAPLIFATVIVLISPYLSHRLIQLHPSAAFYLAPARFYELLLGSALSYIPPQSSSSLSQVLGVAGAIGLLLSVRFISVTDEFPSWRALAPCTATALLIHAGPISFISQILSVKPLVFIGKASYSIYLVHWPVIVFYRLLTGQDGIFGIGERFFMLGAAFFLGVPLNVLVENRFRMVKEDKVIGKDEAPQGLKTGNEVNRWSRSAHECRKLAVIITSVQIILLLAIGSINRLESHVEISVSSGNWSSSSTGIQNLVDDYNSFDVNSVFRLYSEAEATLPGSLPEPDGMGVLRYYTTSYYYENGTVSDVNTGRSTRGVPRVLFLGDSHADQFRHMAYHISKEFNIHVQMWSSPNCMFLLGAVNQFLQTIEKRTELCNRTVQLWEKQLLTEGFDTVVLCGRWSRFVDAGGLYESNRTRSVTNLLFNITTPPAKRRLSDDPSEWPTQFENSRRLFRKGIHETVKYITKTGAQVVLVGQVPLLTLNPTGCTSYPDSQRTISVAKQPQRCGSPARERALSRMSFVREVFEGVRQLHGKKVSTVHPTDTFCDNYLQDREGCRVIINESVLYRDRNHLNGLGASYFALRWKAMGYGGVRWDFKAPP